jgi:hypothetical protein
MADNSSDRFRFGLSDLPMEPPDEFIVSLPVGQMPIPPPGASSVGQAEKTPPTMERAEREHEKRVLAIQAQRDAIEKRALDEEARWRRLKEKLEGSAEIAGDQDPSSLRRSEHDLRA